MNKEEKILEFFKEAFCVDGNVEFAYGQRFEIGRPVVELNDSKRGKFYVALVVPAGDSKEDRLAGLEPEA